MGTNGRLISRSWSFGRKVMHGKKVLLERQFGIVRDGLRVGAVRCAGVVDGVNGSN